MTEEFTADFNFSGDNMLITITGDMKLKYMDDFRQRFKDNLESDYICKTIVLDLSNVGYVDSSGMGALVYMKKLSSVQGVDLVIKSPAESVIEILKATKLLNQFTVIQ